MQYDVTALAERLMAQNTPDSTRAAELLTAQSASLASLREDLKFLKSLHDVLKFKREEVEAQYEGYECDQLWRDGAVDVLDFVEAHLDRAPFSPEGLAND